MWLRSISDYRATPQTTIKNTFYRYIALHDFRNVEEYSCSADNNAIVRSTALIQRRDQQLATVWSYSIKDIWTNFNRTGPAASITASTSPRAFRVRGLDRSAGSTRITSRAHHFSISSA